VTKTPQTPSYLQLARAGGDIAGSVLSPFAADLLAVKTQIKPSKKAAPVDLEFHVNPLGIGALMVMGTVAMWMAHIQLLPKEVPTTQTYVRDYWSYWYQDAPGLIWNVYKGKTYKQREWGERYLEIMNLPSNAVLTSSEASPGPYKENSESFHQVFQASGSTFEVMPMRRAGFLEGWDGSFVPDILGLPDIKAPSVIWALGGPLTLAIGTIIKQYTGKG